MSHDPLGLNETATPEIIREQRATPLAEIRDLNTRITSRDCADSLEVKVMLLSHLLYRIYADLKDTQTK